MSIQMECEYCGSSLIAKRRSRKYCSDSCKTMACRKHAKDLLDEALNKKKQEEEETQRLVRERKAKMQKEDEDEKNKIIQEIKDMMSTGRRENQQQNNGKSIETHAGEKAKRNGRPRSHRVAENDSRENREQLKNLSDPDQTLAYLKNVIDLLPQKK